MSGAGSSSIVAFLPLVAIFAIFYFLLIMPARRQQKKKQAMIASLKKGDRVVTSGGIYGTVAGIEDQTLLLKIAENAKIRISKSAINGKIGPGGETPE
ncbi:MAG: preprotein translocase subunit YajC [Acidobacteria bacterium]|jgi:preprotein translocase subunit YajC|nr:preprotein translocase subunit YajC [Acidobacteriota bacterium]